MKRLTDAALAARAQELADTLHELDETKEAAAKVKKTWAAKVKRIEDKARLLGEAVRLKTDVEEQLELPKGENDD
jgi:hypothetical protein